MDNDLESFVRFNCCNQMGERAKFIEIIQSLEALVEEAYEEGYEDAHCSDGGSDFQASIVKEQLDELKKEVE